MAWRKVSKPELSRPGPHDARGRGEKRAETAPVPMRSQETPCSFLGASSWARPEGPTMWGTETQNAKGSIGEM